ncbi:dihydrolipoyllysine-residue acetyltransferase [Microvirga aerophila]|uniref:Acetyltransferase component of pyruvate dehydrogenase complex n=1 Tax=Microvirga aerophila TaxID=670291 RepID=A0A512C036_9HYPH|nr:acetyltransferase component of pyruvate dehydrogenase complex [Microvirga aerophila]
MATEVKIPDIGDYKDVPIIEVHVKEGDPVNADDPLVSLESDKATMEVPAPSAGIVEKLLIKLGDKVSEGHPIVLLKDGDAAVPEPPSFIEQQEPTPPSPAPSPPAPASAKSNGPGAQADFGNVHASPGVRRLARELELDLTTMRGTGEKGRITKDDVKAALSSPTTPVSAPAPAGGMGIPEIPAVDFSKFGPIETRPLPRIKKISGPHLHRAWLNVPLVTHQDEADITDTDIYRKELDAAAKDKGYRVTLLAFLMKASVSALKQFPEFNASLSPEKDALILKQYYHIGVAVDTPEGLVVPVIRDVDRKGIGDISQELGAVSKKARDGKLGAAEMQGGSFTISSLGGIGGTAFTPLVNAPEVAILGVVRSRMAPVWNDETFQPRLMLPLSVSYDHRVIDGALAARFTRHLAHVLEDVRRLVL